MLRFPVVLPELLQDGESLLHGVKRRVRGRLQEQQILVETAGRVAVHTWRRRTDVAAALRQQLDRLAQVFVL